MPLDRRKQRGFYTRETIKKEYAKLVCMKKIHRISVRELCAQVPCSRNTFYMYFADIKAVAEEIEDDLIDGFLAIYKEFPDEDFRKYQRGDVIPIFMDTMKYIKDNKPFFMAFAADAPDYCFIEKWKKIIKDDFKRRWRRQNARYENEELVLETISSSAIAAYVYWLKNEDSINSVEMCRFMVGNIFYEHFTQNNKTDKKRAENN